MKQLTAFLAKFAWRQRADLYIMVISTVMASGLTLLAQMSLSYMLAPDVFGEIRLIHGYFLLVAPVVMLAIHVPLGRLCIRADAAPRWRVYWGRFVWRWGGPAIGLTGLLALVAASGMLTQSQALNTPLAVLFLAIPVWAILEFYQHFWKFTRARRRASMGLLVSRLGLMGGAVLGGFIWQSSVGFAIGFTAGGILAWLVLRVVQLRFLQTLPLAPEPAQRLTPEERKIVRTFLPMAFLLNVLGAISLQLDVVFLDYMIADTQTAGLYAFALLFANAAQLIQTPLTAYWLPELGRFYDQNRRFFLNRLFVYQAVLTGLVAVAALALYIVVPWVVPSIFAADYIPGLSLLPLLLVRVVVQSAYGLLGHGLFISHAMPLNVGITGLNILLTCGLSWLWIPPYGVEGLIYAKIVSDLLFTCVRALAVLYIVRR